MAKGKKTGGRTIGTPNKRREAFVQAITKGQRDLKLIEKLFELSEGVLVEGKVGATGATFVYKTPPDVRAATYLLDQAHGKATQAIEVHDPTGLFAADKYLE